MKISWFLISLKGRNAKFGIFQGFMLVTNNLDFPARAFIAKLLRMMSRLVRPKAPSFDEVTPVELCFCAHPRDIVIVFDL